VFLTHIFSVCSYFFGVEETIVSLNVGVICTNDNLYTINL